MLVPTVVEREGSVERTYDIFSRLLKDRLIFINGPIEDNMAQIIVAQILFCDSVSDQPIELYINSPGGVVTAGLAILDTARFSKCKINTTVIGQACSMGAFLLTAAAIPAEGSEKEKGDRIALPSSSIMIHQPLGGFQGQASDIEIHAKTILKTKENLNKEIARCSNLTYEETVEKTDRDNFLDAYEAKEMGLIDKIVGYKK